MATTITGTTIDVGTNVIVTDAAGNVGIGTSSPTRKLTVYDTDAYLALQNPTTGSAAGDGFQLQLVGNDVYHANYEAGSQIFTTSGSERMRIDAAGHAIIGGGVTLGNGQTYAAANTLDDYEEGTWTPAWGTASGAQPTVGYSNRYGYYVKIGRLVTLRGEMYLNALTVNGASTSNLLINNLPFTNDTTNTAVGINTSAQIDWARARSQFCGYGNGEFGFLGQTGSTGSTGWSWETISVLASNSEIRFTITYETNS